MRDAQDFCIEIFSTDLDYRIILVHDEREQVVVQLSAFLEVNLVVPWEDLCPPRGAIGVS